MNSDQSNPAGAAEERDQRIEVLSDRLAQQYQQLNTVRDEKSRLLGETGWSKAPSDYERMRERLKLADKSIAVVADEIARTTAELRKVQAENPAFNVVRTDAHALLEAEVLALDRQLSSVADAQAVAVSEWNAQPLPEHRDGFEAKLVRLHAAFDELSAKKRALLQGTQAG